VVSVVVVVVVVVNLSPGFLQVRENWQKSGNLSGQGKYGKIREIFLGKVRENEKLVPPDFQAQMHQI